MLQLSGVLSPEDLALVREKFLALPFQDGKATAGAYAHKVKHNQQARSEAKEVQALEAFVRQAILRHPLAEVALSANKWSKMLFARYGAGDTYGWHMDDAFMVSEDGGKMRTDLSYTLFLSDPDDYEGGELVMDGASGQQEIKLLAGDMILYPTGLVHQVAPVTSGQRHVVVGWIQSSIRRQDQREILLDLAVVRSQLTDPTQQLLVQKSLGNLIRMWAEL